MKQKIDPSEILAGDVVRCEYRSPVGMSLAEEYIAPKDGHSAGYAATYYLLERPEPPFEPYWGMVLEDPNNDLYTIVRLRNSNGVPEWMGKVRDRDSHWHGGDNWAKQKLAEGWVVIAPSEREEGVK